MGIDSAPLLWYFLVYGVHWRLLGGKTRRMVSWLRRRNYHRQLRLLTNRRRMSLKASFRCRRWQLYRYCRVFIVCLLTCNLVFRLLRPRLDRGVLPLGAHLTISRAWTWRFGCWISKIERRCVVHHLRKRSERYLRGIVICFVMRSRFGRSFEFAAKT
jgi:hypothetical protein